MAGMQSWEVQDLLRSDIVELHDKIEQLQARISELEMILINHRLSGCSINIKKED